MCPSSYVPAGHCGATRIASRHARPSFGDSSVKWTGAVRLAVEYVSGGWPGRSGATNLSASRAVEGPLTSKGAGPLTLTRSCSCSGMEGSMVA